MSDPFADLPDAARLWLVATEGDPAPMLPEIRAFCAGWTSHGRPVEARADVLADRVLAVAAIISDADVNAGVSGCGIDSMQHAVEAAAARHGLALSPALAVTVREADGSWASVPRAAFRARVAAGTADGTTPVLDLTPATLGALRASGGPERPAADTWHAAAFRLGAPASV